MTTPTSIHGVVLEKWLRTELYSLQGLAKNHPAEARVLIQRTRRALDHIEAKLPAVVP